VQRRVAITGAGLISPFAESPAALAAAIAAGRGRVAGNDFDPSRELAPRNTRPLDRLSQLVVAATARALADAGCGSDYRAAHAVGLALGTVFSGVRTICAFDRRAIEAGPQYVSPLDFANTVLNAAAGQAAIWHQLRGANATIAAGGASGLQAIAYAADLIAAGGIDAMVAGGADELSAEAVAALADAGRGDDPPLGEAAAMVVLEAEDTACARGAKIRAIILGQASGMAHRPDGSVDASLAARIWRAALDDAGIREAGARMSTDAVRAAVGDTLGAAGALQVAASLERLRAQPGVGTILVDTMGTDGQCCAVVLGTTAGGTS
jgi:3-oxoacyl-[acyl-carrier-protein] synthase II